MMQWAHVNFLIFSSVRVRPGSAAGGNEYRTDGTIGRGLTGTDEKIREFGPGPVSGDTSEFGLVGLGWATPSKINIFLKNVVLGSFWLLLDIRPQK